MIRTYHHAPRVMQCSLPQYLIAVLAVLGLFTHAQASAAPSQSRAPTHYRSIGHGAVVSLDCPDGMVWIPGGVFVMGSTDPLARVDEAPKHRVRVDGIWMDATEVTNAQFRKFVNATGYVTVAEKPIDWDELKRQLPPGTPKPPDDALEPGSLVFVAPDHPVRVADYLQWWQWTHGANWRHPAGPDSSIENRDDLPVVHIAYEDALAYCKWAGRSLPTESQWEFAARGGLAEKVNVWGDEPVDEERANIWQGRFPYENSAADGYAQTAPVRSFPPNGYGLYDTAGNVWEWCSDLYRPDEYARRVGLADPSRITINPKGPPRSFDPRNPIAPESRVQRGGSFLCHDSYCASYRPSARMACPTDTSSQNVGFRTILTPTMWLAQNF